jgi:hypothetical protein
MDWQNPLVLPAEMFPDMSEGDRVIELQMMIERAITLENVIQGNASASQILELIDHQGFDIDGFIGDLNIYGEGW